jgi:hypothetical protein
MGQFGCLSAQRYKKTLPTKILYDVASIYLLFLFFGEHFRKYPAFEVVRRGQIHPTETSDILEANKPSDAVRLFMMKFTH